MAANYAEIGRVGKLKADFHQVLLIKIFRTFYNIVMKRKSVKFSKKIQNNIFLDKN